MPEKLRAVKDKEEIGWIAEAAKITDEVFALFAGEIRPGMTEIEAAARIDYLLMTGAGDLSAFRTIVAGGKRGALPHAHPSHRRLEMGDLVTLDFGAMWNGYCADMTRTVVIGEASERQRELYDAVLEANQRGIEAVRPGVPGADIDKVARDVLGQKGLSAYFGHGLGHGVGVEVHELPNLSPRGRESVVAGNVVTVEPGVYIPGFGGVRIEDLVVVEGEGCRVLSRSPKERNPCNVVA